MNSNYPFWLRRLATRMGEADPVKYAYAYQDRVKVEYFTGFKRSYVHKPKKKYRWAKPITREQSRCEWPIEIGYEHQWDPFDAEQKDRLSKYFHVSRKKIAELSYIECEILIQHIMMLILGSGYLKPYRTTEEVNKELAFLAAGAVFDHGQGGRLLKNILISRRYIKGMIVEP
jgi:hypothetical protein